MLPKTDVSVFGLRVTKAFPESVGMGVGFSLEVDATLADTRKAAEKALGQPLTKCESGDNMRMCGLEIAPQRTVTLEAEDKPGAKDTLIGCYYFYEKTGALDDPSPASKQISTLTLAPLSHKGRGEELELPKHW
jgi:hypothetical protein